MSALVASYRGPRLTLATSPAASMRDSNFFALGGRHLVGGGDFAREGRFIGGGQCGDAGLVRKPS